ncbi:peptidyl-prolyl cis-trans isomerase [Suillus clintonianus]|uniref:peptidyl-prolyl cis-trans isomerase n=1 Tax=Suillus clintonianus TaxID=1904413 RepID=UPI001B88563E|nr:peptidyl-prolyl cis-trans isomerase [Suillus clintonianus]KAG2129120.1 peptidyl-prolyl cis-trans isomerase [Suillus clintonianus]
MGVSIETIIPGDGKTFPKRGDSVTIHYVGTLDNGTVFDSSRDRKDPFVTQIGVGKVIKGWDEGVPQLSLGQKAILTASSDYVGEYFMKIEFRSDIISGVRFTRISTRHSTALDLEI